MVLGFVSQNVFFYPIKLKNLAAEKAVNMQIFKISISKHFLINEKKSKKSVKKSY